MQRTLEEHFAEYKRDGFTLFRNYMPRSLLEEVRAAVDDEFARRFAEHPDRPRATIANLMVHDTYGPHQRIVFGRTNLGELANIPGDECSSSEVVI